MRYKMIDEKLKITILHHTAWTRQLGNDTAITIGSTEVYTAPLVNYWIIPGVSKLVTYYSWAVPPAHFRYYTRVLNRIIAFRYTLHILLSVSHVWFRCCFRNTRDLFSMTEFICILEIHSRPFPQNVSSEQVLWKPLAKEWHRIICAACKAKLILHKPAAIINIQSQRVAVWDILPPIADLFYQYTSRRNLILICNMPN